MIALEILEIKPFMNKLLASEMFDPFLLVEADLINGMHFTMDGHVDYTNLSVEEQKQLDQEGSGIISYRIAKRSLFDLVKGKHTPSYLKVVFKSNNTNTAKILESAKSTLTLDHLAGLYLNILYTHNTITLTTGASYKIFTKDSSLEQYWDDLIRKYLQSNQLVYKNLT